MLQLSADLCEILTGKPPYVGDNGTLVFRQASRAKLDDCFARLDDSGVEQELTDLAKHALAAEPEQRLKNASAVAEGVTKYLVGVQDRLKQAELAGAAAESRAEHATRRRKLVMAIAGLMMLIAAGAAFSARQFQGFAAENLVLAEDNDRKRKKAVESEITIRIEKEKVEQQIVRANELNEQLQYRQYISDMHLVRQAYDDGTIGRVHELLQKHIPAVGKTDRRNFEWYYWWRTSHLESETIDQTGIPVFDLAVSPDQRLIAIHTWQGRFEIRDAGTLGLIAYENEGTAFGLRMEFSADSTRVATFDSNQKQVRIWDTDEVRLRNTSDIIERHSIKRQHEISAIAFSTSESKLAIADNGGQITFWDAQTGAAIEGSLDCPISVTSLAFSPDGSRLAALNSSDDEVSAVPIYDLAKRVVVATLSGRQRSMRSLAWSSAVDRNVIATGGIGGDVCLWHGESYDDLNTLTAIGEVDSLAFSPDGSRLASTVVGRQAVQIWETDSSQLVTIVRGHDKRVNGAEFVEQGQAIVSSGLEGVIKKWDLSRARRFQVAASGSKPGSEERMRWLFGRDTPVRRSDAVLLAGWEGFPAMPTGDLTALSSNGQYLAVLSPIDGISMRLEVRQRTQVGSRLVYQNEEIPTMPKPGLEMAVAGNGSKVAWVMDGGVFIHDVESSRTWSHGIWAHLRSVAMSHDGDTLAVMDGHMTRTWVVDIADGTISNQEMIDTGHPVKELNHRRCFQLPTGFAHQCVFSPDGEHLVIASSHSGLFKLDVHTRKVEWGIRAEVEELLARTHAGSSVGWGIDQDLLNGGKGHAGSIMSVAFSPDGSLLASGGSDRTVRVWDVKTGELRATLLGHSNSVTAVAFSQDSADGQTLTSMAMSGEILVWSAATKQEVEDAPGYWEARAQRHLDSGNTAKAESDQRRFLSLRPVREIHDSDALKDYKSAGKWSEAATVATTLLNATPNDAKLWLENAPVFVLADDEAGYREFCKHLSEHFAGTDNVLIAEHVCKACLILPDAIDLDQLPHETLATSLDQQTHRPGLAPWLWSSRALVAYRQGDAESAIAYVKKSEEHGRPDPMKTINQSILALAYHQLGQPEMSYRHLSFAR